MSALEGVFIGLLVAATLAIVWFTGFVVYRLVKSSN